MVTSRPATELQAAVRDMRPGFAFVAVFSFCLNMLVLASPLYMFQVFDRVLTSGHLETLVALTAMAGLAILVMAVLEAMRGRLLLRIGNWLERRLAPVLIRASLKESLAGREPGAQALRDLAQIRGFISGPGLAAACDAPWVPIFVAILWLQHPWLGWLAAASATLLLGVTVLNDRATREANRQATLTQIAAMRGIEGGLRNAEAIEAMGMAAALVRRWAGEHAAILALQTVAQDRTGLFTGATRFLRLAVQIGILGLGAWLAVRGELTGGGMIAGSILLGRALAPVEQAIAAWKSLAGARHGWERLQELLRRHPGRAEPIRLPHPEGLSITHIGSLPAG